MADLGVSSARIALISYGKEKPGCTESTESCRQMNRRGDFVAAAD
jgi:peptidoglycan-associated lipoprotein